MYSLLNVGDNAKTTKSDKSDSGYLTAILYLASHTSSGHNVCPSASEGCAAACLMKSGYAIAYPTVNEARIRKTKMYFEKRTLFKALLWADLTKFVDECGAAGKRAAVRLNGTSDIAWEKTWKELFTLPIQFYDYTKILRRLDSAKLPPNYHLTFSKSENNWAECKEALGRGFNVAAVFDRPPFPQFYEGWRVHDGDETDLRFLDKSGIIGLRAKGLARSDNSGFVIKVNLGKKHDRQGNLTKIT